MIILKESYGDIKLLKFIGFRIPKIEGFEESHYDEMIGAYLYWQEYEWNSLSGSGDNNVLTHEQMAAELPYKLSNAYLGIHLYGHMDRLIAGGIDIFVEEDYALRLWMYNRYWDNILACNRIQEYLEKKFKSYLQQRVVKP